ncbi:MAG: hypothetical protein QM723_03735 [Myxococcaceae bacterium]
MRRSAIFVLGALVFAGCPKPAANGPDAAVDSGSEIDGGLDAGVIDAGVVDAGMPELKLTGTIELADGGSDVLPAGPAAEVPPLSGFTLHADVALKDFRVRVIDGADQVLPSDDEAHVSDAGTDYTIKLAHPLKPAKTYHLQLDAQTGDTVTDRSGKAYQDYELTLKTQGEPEPTPGKKKKKH